MGENRRSTNFAINSLCWRAACIPLRIFFATITISPPALVSRNESKCALCSKAVHVVLDDALAKDSGDYGLVGRVVPTNSGAGDDLKSGRTKSAYEGLVHIVRKVTVQRSGGL